MRKQRISRMSDMTTRPITKPESDATIGDVDLTMPETATSMAQEWRRFGNFLKAPTLEPNGSFKSPLVTLVRVYALDLVIMLGLLTLAAVVMAAGIELPRTAIADMQITPMLIALVIIGAPVMEELIFRGWLSGRPGWLAAIIIFGAAGLGAAFWAAGHTGEAAEAGTAGIIILALLASGIVAITLRNRPVMAWFRAIFPLMFWLSALGFALVHLANFNATVWYAALPLVLPQLILGSVAGYVRVQVGLWAAMALHAAHNATALAIATLAMEMGAG